SSLHARDAESVGLERANVGLAADGEAEAQNPAGVARVDQAVVPQPGRGVKRSGFSLHARDNSLFHHLDPGLVDRLAFALEFLLGDDRHDLRRLLAAHDRDAVARPGEDEARIIGAAAHAVIAGPERGADVNGELRHRGVGDRLDHLRAVLDDAGALGLAADHVAGRVLQVDDRHVGLAAEWDDLRRLGRAVDIDRPVVADEADGVPFDLGVAAYRVRAVERLEIEEIGFVDDAGDDLAHVVRLAVVARHDAGQLLGRIARLLEGLSLAWRELFIPRKLGHDFARDADAVRIVLGQVFA